MIDNDFSGVSDMAVEGNGVRIGDGLEGFTELKSGKLALHLQKLDIYMEGNTYNGKKD